MTTLGTLSIHLDGTPCGVGCDFCYLGRRQDAAAGRLQLPLATQALGALRYDEVAVAVSDAHDAAALRVLVAAARAPVAVTTTLPLAGQLDLAGVRRLNLSVDSYKGWADPARIGALARRLKAAHPGLDLVLLATLDTPPFAARLVDGGLLAELVALPDVDKVALNALKPPPPWCDRAFWMGALARLAPLLAAALDTRLFLDCYVAARLLGLGACPARPDLSPAAGGVAFRGCVYQPAPDFVVADAASLAARLDGFTAPAACPFAIT